MVAKLAVEKVHCFFFTGIQDNSSDTRLQLKNASFSFTCMTPYNTWLLHNW